MVKASKESGSFLVLIDTDAFGETDAQPDKRSPPMSPKIYQDWVRAVLKARTGEDEPISLPEGDFYCMVNGGKNRRTSFNKPLLASSKGRDPKRTIQK